MNSKRTLLLLTLLLTALLTAGAASAQDGAPRSTPLPGDLLLNESFESNGAEYWTVTGATQDKVKCGELYYGHVSNCAFLLKGSAGENTTIQQVYKPGGAVDSVGQGVAMTAHIRPLSGGIDIKFFIKVKLKDGLFQEVWGVGQWQGGEFFGLAPTALAGARAPIVPKPGWKAQ